MLAAAPPHALPWRTVLATTNRKGSEGHTIKSWLGNPL
jgi:hypothetical protein